LERRHVRECRQARVRRARRRPNCPRRRTPCRRPGPRSRRRASAAGSILPG
jgi:hypothetical protein